MDNLIILQQFIAQTPGKKLDLRQNLKLGDFGNNEQRLVAAGQ